MGGKGRDLVRKTMDPVFDFIDRHQEAPFLVWFAPSLPHVPFDAPYTYRKYYQDKDITESAKLYYANLTWWDDGVGRLLDHIESRGLLENTLFVFVSDNGWEQDAHVEYKRREDSTIYNDSLLGNGGPLGKNGMYDQSFRSPIIFHWKGRIDRSFNTSSLVSTMDIVPTVLDFAGDLGAAGERVFPMAGEQELVFADDVDPQVLGPVGQGDQGSVRFAVLQSSERRGGLLFSQVDREFRKSIPQDRQDARQEERADGRDDPESEFPEIIIVRH